MWLDELHSKVPSEVKLLPAPQTRHKPLSLGEEAPFNIVNVPKQQLNEGKRFFSLLKQRKTFLLFTTENGWCPSSMPAQRKYPQPHRDKSPLATKKAPKTQLVPGKSQMENFTLNGFFCGLGERERSDNALKSGLGRKFMSWFFFLSFSSIYLILWDLCALHPVESWRRTEFNRFQL